MAMNCNKLCLMKSNEKTKLNYSSGIKNMPFLFIETRKTACLMADGKSSDEIIDISINENIFQLKKERRRKELPQTLLKRLLSIDKESVKIIANGTLENAKLLTFISILNTDKLFYEFIIDIFYPKISNRRLEILDIDFMKFFEEKAFADEKVSSWTANNLENIKGTYKKILCEVGLAKKNSTSLDITPFIYDEVIFEHINKYLPNYKKLLFLEG